MSRARAWTGAAVAVMLALGAAGADVQDFSQKGADSPATRSARSDCEGEARRRGYAVLATGNYRQYREGWSIDMRVRDGRGRESTGSCFVETRSGDVSLYGFGWGSDNGGANSFEFNCASIDTKYRECQLPVDGRARVVKRFSEAKCEEGRGWGQRGDRIWVDQGCRARFEVVRGGGSGGNGRVDCRSQSRRYAECRIDRGYVGRLERDYSGGRCSQGNWGSSDGLVWVQNGCQGRFALQRLNGGGNDGANPGQQQRAETQCRNEARRRGMDVRNVANARPRGSYWETTVEGTYRGSSTRALCRYDPDSNRVDLSL
jgi:hypothetical protein